MPKYDEIGLKMAFKVAVAGATGNVGREMLSILAERRFPVSEVVALASSRSIGRDVMVKSARVTSIWPSRLLAGSASV